MDVNLCWLLVSIGLFFTKVFGITFKEGSGPFVTTEKSSFSLTCQGGSSVPTFTRSGFTSTPSGNDVQLTKSSIELTDAGVYNCSTSSSSATITVQVNKVSKFSTSYSFTEGDTIDITCPLAFGTTVVTAIWYKDGMLMNNITDKRLTLSSNGKTTDGRFQLSRSVRPTDRGYYTCVTSWQYGSQNYTTLVRVKEKIAPLWPFIGIVVEVIILALIILFCKESSLRTDAKDD